MSDQKDVVVVARDIVEREMVIGPNDTEAVVKFFDHFGITMPKTLKKSIEEFKKDPNLDTQKKLVLEVNRAITGENSIDKLDEMFKDIVEDAERTAYELDFNDQVEDMLDEVTPQESQASGSEEPSDS